MTLNGFPGIFFEKKYFEDELFFLFCEKLIVEGKANPEVSTVYT